jgi:hypothetical protein
LGNEDASVQPATLEYAWFPKEFRETRRVLQRSIERQLKGLPLLCVQAEVSTNRQNLLRLAESAFQNKIRY